MKQIINETIQKWEPRPLSMRQIQLMGSKITYDEQQDICVVLEEENRMQIAIYNECLKKVPAQFTIASDYEWTHKEANEFSALLKDDAVAYNVQQFRNIYERYAEAYPEWNLKFQATKPLRMLDHIRHCLNKTGGKEILYKAGLDELAANLDLIDDYNIIGTSPSEILGLSFHTLKAINCPYGYKLISTKAKRIKLTELQEKHPWLFENGWNSHMCQSMERLILEETDMNQLVKHFKGQFSKWKHIWTSSQFDTYSSVLRMREAICKEIGNNLSFEITTDKVRKYYTLLVEEKDDWNRLFFESNEERALEYELTDVNYSLTYPETIAEFVTEAIFQRNSLISYLSDYIFNETDILLLRKTTAKNTPYVIVEIHDSQIVQAYGKCNTRPDDNVLKWLKIYARLKGIEYAIDDSQYE